MALSKAEPEVPVAGSCRSMESCPKAERLSNLEALEFVGRKTEIEIGSANGGDLK